MRLFEPVKTTSGSSPRVRGKESLLRGFFLRLGIIPAGAGKSAFQSAAKDSIQDHPRGCGEKSPSRSLAELARGSSPRVRGKGLA